jgi:two-component system sensor histidine kinase DesK
MPAWLSPAPDSAVANVVRRGKSPWTDAVHLMWSIWVFVMPAFSGGYTWRWTWLTLVSYPVFLCLYAMSLLASRRRSVLYALGMAALGIGLLPLYPSGMSYFVFGCVMLRAGSGRILVALVPGLLLLNALFLAVALACGYPWQALVWIPLMTLILAIVINLERIGHDKDAALKLSHDEVRRLAAFAERERIGRDLHDLLGHTLSLVALKSELAARLIGSDASAARRELDDVSRVAREALAQVRSAVTGIRAAGVAAELASARLLLESSGVAFDYDVADATLPADVEVVLALALREAVTNNQRHARARRRARRCDRPGHRPVRDARTHRVAGRAAAGGFHGGPGHLRGSLRADRAGSRRDALPRGLLSASATVPADSRAVRWQGERR